MDKKIIFLGLNELNFEYIEYYIDKGFLPNIGKIINKHGYQETASESEYKLLEPWIQWVTIHTGKTFKEHNIFRLGDIVNNKDVKQFFELIEDRGYSVGAVSPFNADNRLKDPSFFVPDPWTKTEASGEKYLKAAAKAVSQAVNDNASEKISLNSIISLLIGFIRTVPISKYSQYLKLASQIKSKVGIKAILLDKLLGDFFIKSWSQKKPDFSLLFLNTGAHFQHHYMFNSLAYKGKLKNPEWYCPESQDPLLLILKEYDMIIERLLKKGTRIIICTGLHQKPHSKNTYYWRLNAHKNFLEEEMKIKGIKAVTPRMSRDFLITFESKEQALEAQNALEEYKAKKDNQRIFEVDNRGFDLFVELIYADDIQNSFEIVGTKTISEFKKHVSFVAIKNGEHDGIGYYLDTQFVKNKSKERIPLKNVFEKVMNTFP